MIVPNFSGFKIVEENGQCTPDFQQYNDQLNLQMQENISNDGFVIPANTTTAINNFASNTNQNKKPDGTIWYDSDTNQFKGKINGVVKVFTLT